MPSIPVSIGFVRDKVPQVLRQYIEVLPSNFLYVSIAKFVRPTWC